MAKLIFMIKKLLRLWHFVECANICTFRVETICHFTYSVRSQKSLFDRTKTANYGYF